MARYELKLPQMGESVEEATVSSWLKKVGDKIQIDDILVEVATDKVDSEIPSDVSGVLVEILTPERSVVKVGQLMAVIETEVQESVTLPTVPPTAEVSTLVVTPPVAIEEEVVAQSVPYVPQPTEVTAQITQDKKDNEEAPFYSPLVRTIAKEEGISLEELATIEGSGAQGRVTKYDMLRYVEAKKAGTTPATEAPTAEIPVQEVVSVAKDGDTSLGMNPFAPEAKTDVPAQAVVPVVEPVTAPVVVADAETPTVTSAEPQATTEEQKPAEVTPALAGQVAVAQAENPAKEAVKYPDITDFMKSFNASHTEEASVEEKIATAPAEPQTKETLSEAIPVTKTPETPIEIPVKQAQEVVTTTYTPSPVDDNVEVIEMTRMGKLIANYMSESKKISAHATSFIEVDVTRIWNWRNKHKKQFESRTGEKLTFTPIFMEAVAKALQDFPMMNISTDGERIFRKKNINIGMATALPNGDLIVPVIKNADQLSLLGLAKSVNDLAKRARENKLKPEEVKGGTYTVTNIGAFGNLFGTPILNQPEVGILAIGAIQKVPAVVETPEGDVIAIRYKLMLSHSFDHRVVNGALGGMFVQRVAKYLEQWDSNREI